MSPYISPPISAQDEWSSLKSAIVGRASGSCFPSEPRHMIGATMPPEHHKHFRAPPDPVKPFPIELISRANKELDNLAEVLRENGVEVYRPDPIDWQKVGGYTAAMPRDGLMTVGETLIEACFAWGCRRNEISLAFSGVLDELEERGARIIRAPKPILPDSIYDCVDPNYESELANGAVNGAQNGHGAGQTKWAINNTRPAFDCADFIRLGNTLIGQLSNVTNMAGVEYLRSALPTYNIELLEVNDPHAMHIDATLLPLSRGLLVYNPERVTEEELRRHDVLKDWQLIPYPHTPENIGDTELFMTSAWIVLNILSLDENTIIAEERETVFTDWVQSLGIKVIKVPFRAVNSIGGSFHCATVDLVRSPLLRNPVDVRNGSGWGEGL